MALFSMRALVVKRSAGQSIIAAAAYRSGEKLKDDRQDMNHDFRHKSTGVIHSELLLPENAPAWVHGISREAFWNAVDKSEVRKDAQTARDLRVMIPREIPVEERVSLVRAFVLRCFVSKGMVADVCWHQTISKTDKLEQPHVHILLSMRPLSEKGFGPKSRHELIPDPSGKTHPNGKAVMIESNPDSWNSAVYYESCREDWEKTANAALERIGSTARIDRRSLLERGLARLPEPALRLAFHLKQLSGVMRERFGQFQYAKHYQAVEKRAEAAFRAADPDPVAALHAEYEAAGRGRSRDATPAHTVERFLSWFTRQIERLNPYKPQRELAPERVRAPAKSNTPDLER